MNDAVATDSSLGVPAPSDERRGSPIDLETAGRPCWLYDQLRTMCLSDVLRHAPADISEKLWQIAIREFARSVAMYPWLRDLVDRLMPFSEQHRAYVNEFERFVVTHHAHIEDFARSLVRRRPELAMEIASK